MELSCFKSVLNVQHKGQLLVLHLQRTDTLNGRNLILRDDHRDLVAVVADVAVEQQPVRHILMGRICGPGVTRGGERNVRYVKAGQDLYHAGDLPGGRRIDGLHIAVGNGGVADLHDQRTAVAQIVRILRASSGLFIGIYTDNALSDAFAHKLLSFLVEFRQNFGYTKRKTR